MNGKNLRKAIASEDKVAVLEALKDCWTEIYKKMPDYYDEYDLSNDIDDIDNQIDNAVNYEEYDMTEDDVEDEVNYLLDQFYDFCDGARVWVELD